MTDTDDPAVFQPYYTAYALAHGHRDPAGQLAADKARTPTACMTPFILWMHEQYAAWDAEHGRPPAMARYRSEQERAHFGAWLHTRAGAAYTTLARAHG